MLQVAISLIQKEGEKKEKLCNPVILVFQEGSKDVIPIPLPNDITLEDGFKVSEAVKKIILRDYKTIEQVKKDYYNE